MQIVSARSWRGVRARERTFCAEPAHQDTEKDQAGKLAIRSVDNRGGRGSVATARNQAIPTSLAGQQSPLNP